MTTGACADRRRYLSTRSCPVHADWGFDATAGLAYDDNLLEWLEADDRKGDSAFTATRPADTTSSSARIPAWD